MKNFFQSELCCQNRQNISSYLLNKTYKQCKGDCFWKVPFVELCGLVFWPVAIYCML